MKNRSFLLVVSLLFCLSFLQSAQAQSKVISYEEYQAAEHAGGVAAEETFPRIETYTYKSDERDVWKRTVEPSTKQLYIETKTTTSAGTKYTEYVYFDGERFERIDKGVWKRPDPGSGMGSGSGAGAGMIELVYTVEDITEAGKKIKLYTRTVTNYDKTKNVSTFKIDAAKRMVEYEEKGEDHSHGIYEFPKTLPPLKKPILGSKQDL